MPTRVGVTSGWFINMLKVPRLPIAQYAVLAVILSVTVLFHMPAALADLPYINHPDEPTNLNVLHQMMVDGTLNPKFFNYPSLLFYLNAPGQLLANAVSDGPIYLQIQAMGSVHAPVPEAILFARLTSLLAHLTTLSVLFFFLQPRAGNVLAASAVLLTALSPLTTTYAVWAAPDIFATLFVTFCLIACVRIVETGQAGAFVVAGILAGLAATTKYNAGFVAIAIIAAAVLAPVAPSQRARLLARAATCALIAMLAGSPFLLLDFGTALAGFLYELQHYSSGHWGAEGDAFALNLKWLAAGLGAACLLMLPAFRRREMLPVLIFVVGYFALLSLQTVRFERNLALLVPAISMLAALSAADLLQQGSHVSRYRQTAMIALACLIAIPAVWSTVTSPYPDRTYVATGRDWAEEIIPDDAQVVVESYTPYLQEKNRHVRSVKFAMLDDWEQFSPSHLVLSARASQRFEEDPRTRSNYERWIENLTAEACEVFEYKSDQTWSYKVLKLDCA